MKEKKGRRRASQEQEIWNIIFLPNVLEYQGYNNVQQSQFNIYLTNSILLIIILTEKWWTYINEHPLRKDAVQHFYSIITFDGMKNIYANQEQELLCHFSHVFICKNIFVLRDEFISFQIYVFFLFQSWRESTDAACTVSCWHVNMIVTDKRCFYVNVVKDPSRQIVISSHYFELFIISRFQGGCDVIISGPFSLFHLECRWIFCSVRILWQKGNRW